MQILSFSYTRIYTAFVLCLPVLLEPASTYFPAFPTWEELNLLQYTSPPVFHEVRQQKQKETSSGNNNNKGEWQEGRHSLYHQPALPSEIQSCTRAQSKDQSIHRLQLLISEENEIKVMQTLFQNMSDILLCYKVSATEPYLKTSVVAKMFLFGCQIKRKTIF